MYLQSNDMGMSAHFENINLSTDFFSHLHMFDLSFIKNFHSDFLTRDDVMSHCHDRNGRGIQKNED